MDINLVTPINSLGYGTCGINILKALMQKGHKICLYDIGPLDCPENDIKYIREAIHNRYLFNPNAPSLRIYHQNDMALQAGRGLRVGFPIFELSKFTDIELHHLRSLDAIFSPSDWANNILRDHGFNNLWTVPFGVDRTIFHENIPAERSSDTVFLNCGKWEVRKGHDILIEAFNKAFSPEDNVKLIMHCHNPFIGQGNADWERRYMNTKLGRYGKIRISSTRFKTQQELARLMASADCGVFPSRAEGWNLELLEMMSMGKTVIATDYSAHTQYLTDNNSLRIYIDELELAEDGIWFHKQGQWAKFGKDQMNILIESMQKVHAGRLRQNVAGIATAKLFNWEHTAELIVEGFSHVDRRSKD